MVVITMTEGMNSGCSGRERREVVVGDIGGYYEREMIVLMKKGNDGSSVRGCDCCREERKRDGV